MKHEVGKIMAGLSKKEDPAAVKDTIESISYTFLEDTVMIPLTDEQIAEKKTALAEADIKIDTIEKEKKKVNDDFKTQLKEPKHEKAVLLEQIKHKEQEVLKPLYLIPDRTTNQMYYYDETGMCLKQRELTEDEHQLAITD